MSRTNSVHRLTAAALLIAVGVLIPLISPFKITLEPASFTLASHVAVFMAMFISPSVAAAVAAGTTLGFLLGGFPIVVVIRAASHLVFALLGGLFLARRPATLGSPVKSQAFSFGLALVHGLCEVLVVIPFYFTNSMSGLYYDKGFVQSVLLLVGVGSVVHSMVDFSIALVIYTVLRRQRSLAPLFLQPEG